MFSCTAMPPSDWEPVFELDGLQMIWSGNHHPDSEAGTGVVELGDEDVPEMLDLVGFTPRKHVMFRGFRTPLG
ncbi:hypothetical protein [Saccharopolyspora sp. NPDC002376]